MNLSFFDRSSFIKIKFAITIKLIVSPNHFKYFLFGFFFLLIFIMDEYLIKFHSQVMILIIFILYSHDFLFSYLFIKN